MERAIFAGGCFWCMVQPFEEQPGILSVRSGYTGGHVPNPSYEEVCRKTTGHTEAVEIIFDPEIISLRFIGLRQIRRMPLVNLRIVAITIVL